MLSQLCNIDVAAIERAVLAEIAKAVKAEMPEPEAAPAATFWEGLGALVQRVNTYIDASERTTQELLSFRGELNRLIEANRPEKYEATTEEDA